MPKFFIAVPAADCSAQAIRGTGFTAEEALDNAYDRAGFRFHPYVRYDPRASGEVFAHLLDVADTEGWVAFDGRCNEVGAFYEREVAQRAADRTGFVARECSETEFLAAREGGSIAAAA